MAVHPPTATAINFNTPPSDLPKTPSKTFKMQREHVGENFWVFYRKNPMKASYNPELALRSSGVTVTNSIVQWKMTQTEPHMLQYADEQNLVAS